MPKLFDFHQHPDLQRQYKIDGFAVNYFTLCLSGVNNRKVAKLMTLKTIAIS